MRILLMIMVLALVADGWATQMFSWTDAEGNTVYGDDPPDVAVAILVTPPKLTILEGFSSRYGENISEQNGIKPAKQTTSEEVDEVYTSLMIIAPKQGQSIHSNEGDVSAALTLSPKLRDSDVIIITLDGKEHSRSSLRMANFTNLSRGEHILEASIVDKSGAVLISSDPVSFSVMRNSVLLNKKSYDPYNH